MGLASRTPRSVDATRSGCDLVRACAGARRAARVRAANIVAATGFVAVASASDRQQEHAGKSEGASHGSIAGLGHAAAGEPRGAVARLRAFPTDRAGAARRAPAILIRFVRVVVMVLTVVCDALLRDGVAGLRRAIAVRHAGGSSLAAVAAAAAVDATLALVLLLVTAVVGHAEQELLVTQPRS